MTIQPGIASICVSRRRAGACGAGVGHGRRPDEHRSYDVGLGNDGASAIRREYPKHEDTARSVCGHAL